MELRIAKIELLCGVRTHATGAIDRRPGRHGAVRRRRRGHRPRDQTRTHGPVDAHPCRRQLCWSGRWERHGARRRSAPRTGRESRGVPPGDAVRRGHGARAAAAAAAATMRRGGQVREIVGAGVEYRPDSSSSPWTWARPALDCVGARPGPRPAARRPDDGRSCVPGAGGVVGWGRRGGGAGRRRRAGTRSGDRDVVGGARCAGSPRARPDRRAAGAAVRPAVPRVGVPSSSLSRVSLIVYRET
jgi:hypothetical protein